METKIDDTKLILSVAQKLNAARYEADMLEDRYKALRTLILQRVQVGWVGETITLTCGERKIKAKKNSRGRYKVTEGNRILNSQYMHGITELRFEIAMRSI